MKKVFTAIQRYFLPQQAAQVMIDTKNSQSLEIKREKMRQQMQERAHARTAQWVFFAVIAAILVYGLFGSLSMAFAADPQPMQMTFPDAGNQLSVMMREFHDYYLLPISFAISIFVLLLMVYVVWRFSEKRNPVPSSTTHHTTLEVVWTVVPVLILAVLVAPSMRLLYASDKALDYAFTVKITGNQWYWHYDYPDHENFGFDSYMIPEDELKPGQKRLMEVDNPLVIPVDTPIRLQFTASDVLHNWAVSEFAVRVDTVPGQLSEAPLYPVFETGTYYGFCSELCGDLHSFMPIMVKVVSKAEFQEWLKEAKQEFASVEPTNGTEPLIQLAAR